MSETNQRYDDEIDLFDLVDDIWSNKRWVLMGLVGTVILAALYLFKAVPVYKTEAKVKPANASDLLEFDRPQLLGGYEIAAATKDVEARLAPAIFEMDVKSAFAESKSALLSSGYRKDFYEMNLDKIKAVPDLYNEGISMEQNFTKFSELFSVKTSGKKDNETYVQLGLELSEPELAAELLNEFVEYALFRRLRDTYDTMTSKVNARLETLNYQANTMREEYLGYKARRILELKEAYQIAKAVGQTSPVYRNMDLISGEKPPLYMLGTKAIQAEIKGLENRAAMAKDLPRGEDHFIQGLPSILVEIESLQGLQVDFTKIHIARVDEQAIVPVSPIKPRKLLIIALALVAGVFVGIFMALIVAAYGKHKIRLAQRNK